MSNDPNHVRDQAQKNYWNDPQTPKVNEQTIPDYTTRENYNTEIERQRKQGQ